MSLGKGTKLGPWSVKRQIGEGAFARVYEVESSSKSGSAVDYPLVAKVIPLGSGKGKKLKSQSKGQGKSPGDDEKFGNITRSIEKNLTRD